jgi:hypothetical protein
MAGLRDAWNIEILESAAIVATGQRESHEKDGNQEEMPFQGQPPRLTEPNIRVFALHQVRPAAL